MHARRLAAVLLACLLGAAGCSSLSESSSSPFESSSASSRSSESNETKFRNDVESYAQTFAKSGGDFDSFQQGIAELAAKRGVTNWESDMRTYVAIGKGLKKANLNAGQLEAYVTNIAKGDSQKAAAIRQGFNS